MQALNILLHSDIISCDREPIHVPGSIQPHGMMLIVEHESLLVRQVAGEIELRLGLEDWEGRHLDTLIDSELSTRIAMIAVPGAEGGFKGQFKTHKGELLDVSAHFSAPYLIVELEPAAVVERPSFIFSVGRTGLVRNGI